MTETFAEVVIEIETTADRVGCEGCGVGAEAQDRIAVDIRDLPAFGRPARLVWRKRRWRCRERLCEAHSWTETSVHVWAAQAAGSGATGTRLAPGVKVRRR